MDAFTPRTCRAARELVGWTQAKLAETAEVGLSTVRNFETGDHVPSKSRLDAMRLALRRALAVGGVPFVKHEGAQGIFLRLDPPDKRVD